MQDNAGKILVYTLAVAILIGFLVLIFDKEYRTSKIIASNSTYYPGIIDNDIKEHAVKIKIKRDRRSSYKKYKKYEKYKKKRKSPKSIGKKVNINTADKNTLTKVPGITSAIATKIIFYRKIHKGFKTKQDLLKVPGITQEKYDYIKNNISVR